MIFYKHGYEIFIREPFDEGRNRGEKDETFSKGGKAVYESLRSYSTERYGWAIG